MSYGDPVFGNFGQYISAETIIAEKLRFQVQRIIADEQLHCLEGAQVRTFHDDLIRGMVLELAATVAGKKFGTIDIDKQWPADWWQAFRERWAPRWWLKRWPVRYCTFSLHETLYRICPHLHVPENDQRHLRYLIGN